MTESKENMIEMMTLKEAAKLLHCHDIRTVIRFCHMNSITLFHIEGSKGQYVLCAEFISALNKRLKSESGITLSEYSTFIAEKDNKTVNQIYRPISAHEKEFANQLQALINNNESV